MEYPEVSDQIDSQISETLYIPKTKEHGRPVSPVRRRRVVNWSVIRHPERSQTLMVLYGVVFDHEGWLNRISRILPS